MLTRLDTRRVRWLMWGVLAFGYVLMSFTRVSTAVLAESLTLAFDVTATELGLLHSSFFYLYAAMQLPAGLLADRYGPRRVAGAGTFVMGLGAVTFATSDSFLVGFLARALVGLGGSVIFLAILRFAVTWFRADEYATVTGMTIGVSALGGIVATTPLALAASVVGWRASMIFVGACCVVSALGIFLVVRDRPASPVGESPESTDASAEPADDAATSLRADLRSVLEGPNVWVLGVLHFLILGVNFTVIGLWGVPYLVHLYDLSVARASLYVLAGNVGLLVGSPLFGWVADQVAADTMLVLCSSLVFCLVYGTITALGTPPLGLVGVLFFAAMFVSGGTSLVFPVGRRRHLDEVSGTVSGAINSIGYFGAAVVPAVMGAALDVFWTGKTVGGTPVYSFVGYRVAFGIATAAGLAALACALWIHRTRLTVE
ncbi:MFS transporter [Halopenitus persicus]|uniref:MFS transporter n=1 Tax=Halopenitus persicus TaxID=1048396 RepID=UPI000BBAC7C0|nr:MFS transporter [Halopenitus persicus]